MQNNIEVLKKIAENYDPKTAFDNKELLAWMNSLELPNSDGYFEVEGQAADVHQQRVSFYCPNCGRIQHVEVENGRYQVGDRIMFTCNCKAKLQVDIEYV